MPIFLYRQGDYDAVLPTGTKTTLQITKKNKDIIVCAGGKILFTFLALSIGRARCFEEIKGGEETVSIRVN